MLTKIIISLALFTSVNFSQQIHNVLVPNLTNITTQQGLNEFWQYHSLSKSVWNMWYGNSYLQQNFGYQWPNPMLVWDENGHNPNSSYQDQPWTRFNANVLIGYARAWRAETDINRKNEYYSYATQIAEYLLCLQNYGGDGGFIVNPTDPAPRLSQVHPTAFAGVAMVEAYLSFHDARYLQSAINSADWEMTHPTYPYQYPGDTYKYYSNANHLGLQLWHLANVYALTGKQHYLDRCMAIAEEIIAWQDYIDARNPWPNGAIPDGGWYWYDYSATPVPPGTPPPPSPGGGWAPQRKMGYHTFTLNGLVALLEVVGQHTLPGTTTLRNGTNFRTFKTSLTNSIVKAVNYIIDNQETVNGWKQYKGCVKYYKNGIDWEYYNNTWNSYVSNVTSSTGLGSIVKAYNVLSSYGEILSSTDIQMLKKFVNSLTENYLGHYDGNYTNSGWSADGMFPDWGMFLHYQSLSSVPVAKNLGFEDDKIIWELWSWDGGGLDITTTHPYSGSKSVHMVDNSANHSKWVSQIIPAKNKDLFSVTAFAHIISGNQYLYVDFLDKNFNTLYSKRVVVSANQGFTLIQNNIIAPSSNTAYARIYMYAGWYEVSDGYWDDIVISKTAFPTFPSKLQTQNNSTNPEQDELYDIHSLSNIKYYSSVTQSIKFKIFDVLGREIKETSIPEQVSGYHYINLDAKELPVGIYFCRMQTEKSILTKKIIIVK